MEATPRTLPLAITLFLVQLQSMKEAPPGGPQDLRLISEVLQKSMMGDGSTPLETLTLKLAEV